MIETRKTQLLHKTERGSTVVKIILRGAKFVTNKAYLHQRSNADKKWGQGNQKAGNRAHARSLRALRKSLALQKRIDRRG